MKNKTKYQSYWIFGMILTSRCLFIFLSGMSPFDATPDTFRYDLLSSRIVGGEFNMDIGIFIVAPLYPWFLASMKFFFGSAWLEVAVFIQTFIAALSGVCLWKVAKQLFCLEVAILSTFLFCLFPFTMWYTHALLQEGLFQSLLIFSVYFFLKDQESNNWKDLIISACLFSLTFLTKSHILFFSPFIALIIFLTKGLTLRKRLAHISVYAGICLLMTLPYGLYNLGVNNTYSLSSNGFGKMLWYGNSEFAYAMHTVDLTREHPKYEAINSDTTMLLMDKEEAFRRENFDLLSWLKVFPLNSVERQQFYLGKAKEWVRKNPKRFLHLKWLNCKRFFTPGVSKIHYPFRKWLAVLLVSLPIYFFAYVGIWKALKIDFRKHSWLLFLIFSMLIFTLFYGMQSRFRTITLESFYLIYAAFGLLHLFPKIKGLLCKLC